MDIDRRSALMLGAAASAAFSLSSASSRAERRTEIRGNPVLFWNAVSLDLLALDHSIDPSDARAPGPCASSRALGLAHAVIADAVSIAYQPTTARLLPRQAGLDIEYPALRRRAALELPHLQRADPVYISLQPPGVSKDRRQQCRQGLAGRPRFRGRAPFPRIVEMGRHPDAHPPAILELYSAPEEAQHRPL